MTGTSAFAATCAAAPFGAASFGLTVWTGHVPEHPVAIIAVALTLFFAGAFFSWAVWPSAKREMPLLIVSGLVLATLPLLATNPVFVVLAAGVTLPCAVRWGIWVKNAGGSPIW